jgi:hypothetical protein
MPRVSPKQTDPRDGDVMSALPRTRPQRATARRAAARQSAAAPRPKATRPKPATAVKPPPAPVAGYATREAEHGAPAPVEAVKHAIEGVVNGLRSRVPFLPKR